MTSRPLRADARRKRELILASARELLATGGLGVSFDEIARHAGIGVGTVYRHFATREALFEAVVVTRIEEFVTRAQSLADAPDPARALDDYLTHVITQMAHNQDLCEAIESSTTKGFSAPVHLQTTFLEAFEALLGNSQRAGHTRADLSTDDLLDLTIAAATAERRATARNARTSLITVLLAGLRPRD